MKKTLFLFLMTFCIVSCSEDLSDYYARLDERQAANEALKKKNDDLSNANDALAKHNADIAAMNARLKLEGDELINKLVSLEASTRQVAEPKLLSIEFVAADNSQQLKNNITCEIVGDSIIDCWLPSIMKEKYLIPRFTFDGTLVTIDEKEAESGVSMFDFTKPVVLTVHTSAKSVSYKMYVHAYTGLPLLYIDIAGKREVTSKDYYLDATLRLVEDVKTRAAGDVVSAPVHIKGRGNSSWTQPKKPYRLKFDEKIALLGEHKDKSWVLVANYSDKSMLRNSLSYYMGKVSNLEWTPSSHFVELFINGQHRGTYLLCEKVKVAKHRVNVGDDGFLLECNRWADQEDGNVYFYTPNLTPAIVVKEPDVVAGDANFEYVRNYMLTAEQVLFSANFADPNVGWQKYMDMDSFVDWYLIHEMSKNVDCMFNFSTYLNLPRGGKLRMGPIWDFDIAYGNIKQSDSGYLKWVFPSGNLLSVTKWYSRLMKDPVFVAKLKERFNYFYSHKNEFLTYLNESAQYLRYSVEENEAKWGTLYHYTFKNYNIWGSYFNEVQDLKEWLNARLDWMKEDYDKLKP